jgi:hypothetical protein
MAHGRYGGRYRRRWKTPSQTLYYEESYTPVMKWSAAAKAGAYPSATVLLLSARGSFSDDSQGRGFAPSPYKLLKKLDQNFLKVFFMMQSVQIERSQPTMEVFGLFRWGRALKSASLVYAIIAVRGFTDLPKLGVYSHSVRFCIALGKAKVTQNLGGD